jgi:hypothetical protein
MPVVATIKCAVSKTEPASSISGDGRVPALDQGAPNGKKRGHFKSLDGRPCRFAKSTASGPRRWKPTSRRATWKYRRRPMSN